MLRGITVTLYEKTRNGTDGFNNAIYEENPVTVENVLICPLSETEIMDTLSLTGKKAVYQLAIPKGDNHDWENVKVSFFGKTFKTIGAPLEGIEELIPLAWNKKVRCEYVD